MKRPVFVIVLLLCALGVLPAAEARTPRLVRIALVVGANDGGSARVRLRYATSDAALVGRVLVDLGGVRARHRVVLEEPTVAALRAALAALPARVAKAREGAGRVEVVFYYSGHSDDEGLLLRGARLPYPELRKALAAVPANVRIGVVDSCASGALTRTKGGKRRPAFLLDESTRVRGHAFLTSSSEDEVAQESDRIGGSFFTHFLVAGLRGAADGNRDGQVTLSEAYQYAYAETLARTERTRSGPQHPAYEIQLSGTGDLVMTEIRSASARLVLAGDIAGRVFVRAANGRLVAELRKARGGTLELGLDAGRYVITAEQDKARLGARVELTKGKRTRLRQRDLRPIALEHTVARGDKVHPPPPPSDDEIIVIVAEEEPVLDSALVRVPFNAAFLPGLSVNGDRDPVVNNVALNFLAGYGDQLRGFEFGLGLNWRGSYMLGAQLSLVANWVDGDAEGLQMAGLFNYAGTGRVLQIGGVNVGGESLLGAQIGLVNVAGDMRGAQIGLVNVARHSTVPVGIINIIEDGLHQIALVTSDLSALSLTGRLGGRYFYTLLELGLQPELDPVRWSFGMGFGGQIPIGERFFVTLDASAHLLVSGDEVILNNVLTRVRLGLGFRILPRLAVVAGATGNALAEFGASRIEGLGYGAQQTIGDAPHTFSAWPGFFVGLEY